MNRLENLTEIVDKQNLIISEQSSIIYDLFQKLNQYMTQEEIDSLPEVAKINALADIKNGVGL
jgi:predicted HTH domain antitoxin